MILALLQTRTGTAALPGRALAPLARGPLIVRQVERVARARRIDRLVVVTSTAATDDALAEVVQHEAVALYRGPAADPLGQLIGALDAHPADHVVLLTGDSPLIDPALIDATVALHLAESADHTSNRAPGAAAPRGQGVEVITAAGLRRMAEGATPAGWASRALLSQPDQGEVCWAVETPNDYAFAAAVYDALYPENRAFSSADVRQLLQDRPDLATFGGARRL